MEKELLLNNKIPCVLNEFEKNDIVIMSHGTFSSGKNFIKGVEISKGLNNEKISNLRFSAYGHGEREENFEKITLSKAVFELEEIIEHLIDLGYKNIHLIGSSFGGAVSEIVTSKNKYNIKSLTVISPVSNYKKKMDEQRDIKNWRETGITIYDDIKKLNYSFYDDFKNYDFDNLLKNIKCKTFIIHGNLDKSVDVNQSILANDLIENSDLLIINKCNHHYDKKEHFELLIDNVTNFLLKEINNKI